MKLYKSPVTIHEQIVNDLIADYREGRDKAICKAIVKIGIDVNKEELIKALHYDRQQYKKGYEDAVKDFAEKVKASKDILFNNIYSGFHFNVIIDSIAKEMVGGNNG